MGKGNASEHLGDGQYKLTVLLNRDPIDARIKKLEQERSDLEARRVEIVVTEEPAAQDAYEAALDSLDSLINSLSPGDANYSAVLAEAVSNIHEAVRTLSALVEEKNAIIARQTEIRQEIRKLQAVRTEYEVNAWCADLSTNLAEAGELGTIEVPGEIDPTNVEVVIRPNQIGGASSAALYNSSRDGILTPALAMSPEAVWYAEAILPGWQVFSPTYRFGRITKLSSEGTVDVVIIGPNTSSNLPGLTSRVITPRDVDSDLPIELTGLNVRYMTCNVVAFQENDEVVIDFSVNPPEVIGFRREPRDCNISRLVTELGTYNSVGTFQDDPSLDFGDLWWSGDAGAVSWNPDPQTIYRNGEVVYSGFGLPDNYLLSVALEKLEEGQLRYNIVTIDDVQEGGDGDEIGTLSFWSSTGGGPWVHRGSHPLTFLIVPGVDGTGWNASFSSDDIWQVVSRSRWVFNRTGNRALTWMTEYGTFPDFTTMTMEFQFPLAGDVTSRIVNQGTRESGTSGFENLTPFYGCWDTDDATPLTVWLHEVGAEMGGPGGPGGGPGSGFSRSYWQWPDGSEIQVQASILFSQPIVSIHTVDVRNKRMFAIVSDSGTSTFQETYPFTPTLFEGTSTVWTGATSNLNNAVASNPRGAMVGTGGFLDSGLIGVAFPWSGGFFGRVIGRSIAVEGGGTFNIGIGSNHTRMSVI